MRRGLESTWSREARLAMACAAALLLPLLFPLAAGGVFTRDDLGAAHLPFRFLYQDALRSGQLLLWTPAYHSGFFLFGAGEAGMAHPLHAALYRLLPLGPAFTLEIAANYVWLFCGTALLWRRLGLSREGALVGAMTFAFSGFTIFNTMHLNHIFTFAHAPWMLLAAHVLITSTAPRSRALAFAGLALAGGLQLLAGNPQYVWLTAITMLALLAWLKWQGAPWLSLAQAVAALGCGGLVGAIQLAPTLEFLGDSTRDTWSRDAALSFSLSPFNLLQLWSPFAFEFRVVGPPSEEFIVHEFVVYNGALATAAIALTLFQPRLFAQPALRKALLIFAGVNLLLALGRHGPLYPLLVELPGVRSLRAPARHLLLVHFAVSGLTGLVFERLRSSVNAGERWPARSLWPLAAVIALTVITTIVSALLAGSSWAQASGLRFSSLLRGAPAAVIVIGVIATFILAAQAKRWALAALVIFTALDLGLWGYTYFYRWGRIETIDEIKAAATAPPEARAGDVISTYAGGREGYAILRGLRVTWGYTGLQARRVLDFRNPITERLAGLTWQGDGQRWQRVEHPLPRARLMSEAVATDDPRGMIERVDVGRVALVDQPLELSGPPGTVTVLDESPGRFHVRTQASGQQLLVMTERFHRGWRMSIDGEPARPVRVYGDFLGGVVPAGDHEVRLTFSPDSVRTGLQLAVLGVILTAGGAALLGRQRPALAA